MLRKKLTFVHARLQKERVNVKKMKFDDVNEKEKSKKSEKNENEKMKKTSVESAKNKKKK